VEDGACATSDYQMGAGREQSDASLTNVNAVSNWLVFDASVSMLGKESREMCDFQR
jgi:hypothetical protein